MVQWRKLFDRNPQLPQLSDKLLAKQWVHERCPDLAIPETVWIGTRPEDIPDDLIAPGYVIKTNHGSTNNYFPGRENLSREEITGRFRRWLASHRSGEGEWASGQIDRKVFVERLVEADGPMIDLGIRAFDGQIGVISIATDYKTKDARWSYVTADGKILERPEDATRADRLDSGFVVPPGILPMALRYAGELSRGIDYVRVDLLCARGRLYFSEMTFYPASGLAKDESTAALNFRNWISTIGLSHFLQTRQRFPMSIYAAAFRRWTTGWRDQFAAEDPVSTSDCPRQPPV
jgi:hypothetical protein